jgi:hypothetical protein
MLYMERMMSRVLALINDDGDVEIAYASPFITVEVIGEDVRTFPVPDCAEVYDLRGMWAGGSSGVGKFLRMLWQEVHTRRNADVRVGLIGG